MPADRLSPHYTVEPDNILVGRENEQRILLRQLEGVEQGDGGKLALVSGEAGIGKTTLIQDLITEAEQRGHLVTAGHCYDFLAQSPYAPWTSILQSLNQHEHQEYPPLEQLLDVSGSSEELPGQQRLYEAVSRLLENAAQNRPLVLALEDIHWADQASLDLLRYLTRHPVEQPMLIVATYRDNELEREAHLYRLLPSLIRDSRAERIELRRLDGPSVHELTQRSFHLNDHDDAQLAGFIFRLAEGNPFFTWELLRSLEHEGALIQEGGGWKLGDLTALRIPPLIRQIIDLRLSSLSDRAREALRTGAVLGGDIMFDVWRRISGLSESDLVEVTTEALEAHILIQLPSGSRLRFSHELVRETLYQELALPMRRTIHRAVAGDLAETSQADPAVIAAHFQAADDDRTAFWLLRAGIHAHAVYAPFDAVRHLSDALARTGELTTAEHRQAHSTRARCYGLTGDFERARADFESALRLAREDGDPHAEWEATAELGMLWAERDYNQTYDYLGQALDLARTIGDSGMLGSSLNRLGNWYLNNDETAQAERFHLEALGHFTEADDRAGIADTLDLLGLTRYMAGDLLLSAENFRESISLFRMLDRREGLSSSLVDLMMCGGSHETLTMFPAFEAGEDVISYGIDALEIARTINWRAGESYALSQIAVCLALRGDYGQSFEFAEQGRDIADRIDHREWTCASHLSLGWIYLDLLQLSHARAHTEQSRALGRELNSRLWFRSATATLAEIHLLLGNAYEARAVLDECLSPSDGMGTIGERNCWLVRSEIALATGDAEASLEIVDQLIESAPGRKTTDVIPKLWKARADALTALNRVVEAIELLHAARDRATSLNWPVTHWHIDASLARAYRSLDRRSGAVEAVSEAESTIKHIAETIPDDALRSSFLRDARQQLPDAGAHQATRNRSRPLDLTPREIEVLQMVADGQTDREIADELSISPRTVMNHIGNIFNKLGVNSRAAATAQAIRNGLI